MKALTVCIVSFMLIAVLAVYMSDAQDPFRRFGPLNPTGAVHKFYTPKNSSDKADENKDEVEPVEQLTPALIVFCALFTLGPLVLMVWILIPLRREE